MKKDIFEMDPKDTQGLNRVAARINQLGGKGQMAARGLDDLGQGELGNKASRDASAEYIENFREMLADTMFGPKLMMLMKQFQSKKQKDLGEPVQNELPGMDVASVDNNEKPVNENFAYGMPGQEEDKETVTYSKTKKQGDSTVTISANADSMKELHDILKLAGITLPKDKNGEEPEEEVIVQKDEPCPDCGEVDCACDGGCDHNDEPNNAPSVLVKPNFDNPSYTTDKETLIGMLKDKLKKSLS